MLLVHLVTFDDLGGVKELFLSSIIILLYNPAGAAATASASYFQLNYHAIHSIT